MAAAPARTPAPAGPAAPSGASRLWAFCGRCNSEGSRDAFYIAVPSGVPAFKDKCPNCKSEDVNIYDPAVGTVGSR